MSTPSPSLANCHLQNQRELVDEGENDTDSQVIELEEESEELRDIESPIKQKEKIVK